MIRKLLLIVVFGTLSAIAMAQTITTHMVQRGETAESIATLYSITTEQLFKANPGAEDLFYVGLKLNIPAKETVQVVPPKTDVSENATLSNNVESIDSVRNHNMSSTKFSLNDNKDERNALTAFNISWLCSSFKDIKGNSFYGFGIDAFNIGGSLFGFNTTISSFNYGLVNSESVSDEIFFGPNVSYWLNDNVMVCLPLQGMCNVYFEEQKDKAKLTWGLSASPRVYFKTDHFMLHGGLIVAKTFVSKGKVGCGFTVGVSYCM